MKIDWEAPPLWHLYLMWYALAGMVVVQSMDVEGSRRQCAGLSPPTFEGKLVAGMAWPVTAGAMMLLQQDPFAVLTSSVSVGMFEHL